MKIILNTNQVYNLKKKYNLIEQIPDTRFASSGEKKALAKTIYKPLDKHELMSILALGTSFIPIVGPFISAGISLGDAYMYYKENDKSSAALSAGFALLPLIGPIVSKIPGVKTLGQKGMAALASKLSKGGQGLSALELEVAQGLNANKNLISTSLSNTSKVVESLSEITNKYKSKYIQKFGQESYDSLMNGLISGKTTKEQFTSSLKSASESTYELANFAANRGVKFTAFELSQIDGIIDSLRTPSAASIRITKNGKPTYVKIFSGFFDDLGSSNGKAFIDSNLIKINLNNVSNWTPDKLKELVYHEVAHIKDPSFVSSKMTKGYNAIVGTFNEIENQIVTMQSLGGLEAPILRASKRAQDLYRQYYYHFRELVANNQIILNNIPTNTQKIMAQIGPKGAKSELDNLLRFAGGTGELTPLSGQILGEMGFDHLIALKNAKPPEYQKFLRNLYLTVMNTKKQLSLLESISKKVKNKFLRLISQ